MAPSSLENRRRGGNRDSGRWIRCCRRRGFLCHRLCLLVALSSLVLEEATVPSLKSVTFNWSHCRRGASSPVSLAPPRLVLFLPHCHRVFGGAAAGVNYWSCCFVSLKLLVVRAAAVADTILQGTVALLMLPVLLPSSNAVIVYAL
ncbi:hypothetical protein PIB30_051609 [Stylosanthes scabra]|uniref:Uncharacterized protein n=1 Tax=Stylosanthes scabra TaxID=79078 RepID=A0ABU6QHL6_9FABA|nr:hypothetical protein [Stylosanthes scabra]